MMKIVIAGMAALALSGCLSSSRQPQTVYVPRNVMAEIPPQLLECVRVKYPNADTLTDREVARLVANLDSALRGCTANMEAIKRWQEEARRVLAP